MKIYYLIDIICIHLIQKKTKQTKSSPFKTGTAKRVHSILLHFLYECMNECIASFFPCLLFKQRLLFYGILKISRYWQWWMHLHFHRSNYWIIPVVLYFLLENNNLTEFHITYVGLLIECPENLNNVMLDNDNMT